jgi:NhaP-type Na+/H+ or K+/H+ antiporter
MPGETPSEPRPVPLSKGQQVEASLGEPPPSAWRRLIFTVGVALLGFAAGTLVGDDRIRSLVTATPYFVTISVLLAIGLYSSTHAIERTYLRHDLGTVLLAVTVGVLVKALLISALMFAFFREPAFIALGVVVAQIDPLSVAALEKSSRMSERGKALLLAWASFDDPVTTLLTVYAVSIALAAGALAGGDASRLADGGVATFGVGLTWNLLLAGVIFVVWWAAFHRRERRRAGPKIAERRGAGHRFSAGFLAQCALLVAAAVAAVWQFWMLAIALVGLFLRPRPATNPEGFGRFLERLTTLAFILATVALGVILVPDVRWGAGLALGGVTFLAQVLVGTVLGRSQERTDRVPLALAQQNGITAMVLALLLESSFPGTVAIVAPAILTINVLHVFTNGVHNALRPVKPEPEPVSAQKLRIPRKVPVTRPTALAPLNSPAASRLSPRSHHR